MVKVSFVCPVFNKQKYLKDVINSIKTTGELPVDELKAAVEAFVSTLEKKEE